jgi:head-tail adaptor
MSVSRSLFKQLANNFVSSVFADFTKPFIIQVITRVSDGQGGFTKSWSNFASLTGFVELKSGGQVVTTTGGGSKIDQNEIYIFQFEYIDGITLSKRIVYEGETYNIVSIKALQEVDVWLLVEATKGEPT